MKTKSIFAVKEYEEKYQTNIIALEEYDKYICCGRFWKQNWNTITSYMSNVFCRVFGKMYICMKNMKCRLVEHKKDCIMGTKLIQKSQLSLQWKYHDK